MSLHFHHCSQSLLCIQTFSLHLHLIFSSIIAQHPSIFSCIVTASSSDLLHLLPISYIYLIIISIFISSHLKHPSIFSSYYTCIVTASSFSSISFPPSTSTSSFSLHLDLAVSRIIIQPSSAFLSHYLHHHHSLIFFHPLPSSTLLSISISPASSSSLHLHRHLIFWNSQRSFYILSFPAASEVPLHPYPIF